MIIDELFEGPQLCPECGGISFSDLILAEKKDACYYKVKASAKVWPSAYASGRLVQCRKKGAANYGKSKTESVAEAGPFSYGAKKPRKGSVADLAAEKRKKQEKGNPPIEPKDQMVGVAKVTKGVAEGSEHISSMIQQYEDMVELVYDLPPGRKKNIAIDKRDALEAQIEAMPGGKEALRKWAKSYNDAMDEGVAEAEYDSRKPFGVRYKVFAGREGRMTTREYWTSSEEKLQRAVDKIQALDNFYEIDGYSYPKESQGVAEGSSNWYVRVKGKVLKDKKFDAIPFPSQESARLKAMEIHNKKRIPLDMIKLTQSWMDGPETQGMAEQQELDEKWSAKYKSSINCANPRGFSQRAHCAGRKKNEDVAEAGPIRRDPLDLPPLEGPGSGSSGGGGPSKSGPSPFTPVKIPGTNINIPGVTQSTGPPPVVTKTPNINKQLDPALDVPAYVRRGLPDPVTTPVGKPKITVRPGETVPQAIERTKAEQEFGQFLKGKSGQTFGAGAGRGSVNPPAAKSNTPKELTIDPNDPKTFTKQATSSNPEMDKIMKKWDQEQRSAPSSSSSPSKSKTSPSKFLQLFGSDKIDEESRKKRDKPEVDYDDDYDAMVTRVKKLAGLGPMKTVYDPKRRVYRNMPTAVQPKK